MAEMTFENQDPHHIVWDWNGTLLDDNHANLAAVNAVCASFGRAPVELEYWRSIFRRPLIPCYEELLGQALTEEDWALAEELYHTSYVELLSTCGLAPGVPDVLHDWTGQGRTQSLLSMAGHEHLVPLIDERGLTSHFTRIDGRRFDTGQDSKTEHLVHHLRNQNLDPSGVVLIGDIDDDARAAREAGARPILVASGLMARERLEATGALVVDTAAEAVTVALSLN